MLRLRGSLAGKKMPVLPCKYYNVITTIMSETTGTINCPACGMSFDTRAELERHSKQQHATITAKDASVPSFQERAQSRTEEKGKGETTENH
jgi:uncharacterized Zn finger protein (UPF0148 family)